ncbi:helix-turn-helix domain-containing protein [Leptospira weilii]|uniref:helix-turn-helix domain-containing protein n=1 Tax=Leptospira weilii TaxID=28184 RepID=UPI0002E3067F|nr:helix-turn-helix transcriptional regulator [Leptospira weilii]OMI18864.1 DNA-binding protein [Leptospira weilii serovar Heyan]
MKERILKIIETYSLTKKEFAEKIGISTGNLSDLFSGRIKNLSPQVVTNIAKVFRINPIWLILGEGEMISQPEQNQERDERLGAEFRILQLLRKRPILKLTVDDFLQLDRDLSEEERSAIGAMLKSWKPINKAK